GPDAPEPTTVIGDEVPDLDRERPGERLPHRDPLAHLVFREPLPLLDEFSLHLAAEGDGPAEPERAEAQEVGDEPADRDSFGRLWGLHSCPFQDHRAEGLASAVSVTLDARCIKRYALRPCGGLRSWSVCRRPRPGTASASGGSSNGWAPCACAGPPGSSRRPRRPKSCSSGSCRKCNRSGARPRCSAWTESRPCGRSK